MIRYHHTVDIVGASILCVGTVMVQFRLVIWCCFCDSIFLIVIPSFKNEGQQRYSLVKNQRHPSLFNDFHFPVSNTTTPKKINH